MCMISVLTPIYNVEKYLSVCLESLHQQTMKDIEFICINDGSTDCSLKIIEKYLNMDERFRMVNQSNGGYGKAMNAGLDVATGDYVGILESDDFAEPKMFERLAEIAEHTHVDIIKANYYQHIDGEDFFFLALPSLPRDIVFSPSDYLNDAPYKSIWTGLYKRSMLLKNKIRFNETPGASFQDTSFMFKCFACASKAYMTDSAFVHYRMDNMASSSNDSGKVFCICDEYNEIDVFLNNHPELPIGLRYLEQRLKFDDYRWNYNRLVSKKKYIFLEKMIQEFKQMEKRQFLVKKYWQDTSWEIMQQMIHEPEKFMYHSLCEKNQNMMMLRQFFWEKVRKFSHVYLYGAGQVAKRTAICLRQHGVRVEAFLVSDVHDNDAYVLGTRVHAFDADSLDKENSLVIVAVSERAQWQIMERLLQIDGLEVLSLNSDLRDSLLV